MKKNISAFAATFALAFATVGSASADGLKSGNIFDFVPVTETVKSDNALGAAQEVKFKLRLLTPNPEAPEQSKRKAWQVFYRDDPFAQIYPETYIQAQWAMFPLRVGVVVSGQTRGCDITLPTPVENGYLSEITCTYMTKYGDLALPMKLAKNDHGGCIGDLLEDPDKWVDDNYKYYFVNNTKWMIGYVKDDGTVEELKPYRCQDPKDVPAPILMTRNGSYDLAWSFGGKDTGDKAYFIKTVGFDNLSYTDPKEGTTWWRMVHEGSTTPKPDVPKISYDGQPVIEQEQYIYVWSEDDTVVTLNFTDNDETRKKEGISQMQFRNRKGEDGKFWVKKIRIDDQNRDYRFTLRGTGTSGDHTKLVMSTTPHYNFDGTGDLLDDFLTADVLCGERLKPTITVKVNGLSSDTVNAVPKKDIATPVATMTVSLSEAYPNGDLELKVLPKLAKKGVAGASAIDYFGMSFKTEPMSYNDKETNLVFKAGEPLEQTVFLYSWGAVNDKTYGVDASVMFEPVVEDATARGFFEGGLESAYLMVKPIKPEIVEPEDDADPLVVELKTPKTIRINVADTFNDMSNTNGYEVYFKEDTLNTSDPVLIGHFKPDADGYLWSVVTNKGETSKEPELVWTRQDILESYIYVKSPESGERSVNRMLKIGEIQGQRQILFTTLDGAPSVETNEGATVSIQLTLMKDGKPINPTDDVYAFLVPLDPDSSNAVFDASWLAAKGGIGVGIKSSETGKDTYIDILDGTINPPRRGTTLQYEVELRTQRYYEQGTPVPGYKSTTFTVYSQNVIPWVEGVELNNGVDNLPREDGSLVFQTVVSKNVTNEFRLTVNEPGDFDKTTETKPFETKWIIRDKNGTATVVNPPSYGNPDTNVFYWAFKSAGTNTVEVQLKDKDMSKYGNGTENGKFVFKIVVVDNPTISVTTRSGGKEFYENVTDIDPENAKLDVKVTMNPLTDKRLMVELAIGPTGAEEKKDAGVLELAESSFCKWMKELSVGGTNVYWITFDESALVQSVDVKTLDGTKMARFPITVRALNEIDYPGVPGEKVNTYYKGQDTTIRVINVDPVLSIDDISPNPAETNKTSIGFGPEISWDNIIDVRPDFEIDPYIIVKFTGGGGTTNIVITNVNNTAGSWAPYFKDSGVYTVKMQVLDKDGGKSESFNFIYEVEASKAIDIVAHGPNGGFGAALGKRYRAASGLGEGRVWGALPDLVDVLGFSTAVNGGLASKWYVYGYGYKVGDVDDGVDLRKPDGFGGYTEGYWTSRDVPLDGNGNKAAKIKADGDKSAYYQYKAPKDKNGNPVDSFLYTWLQIVPSEDGAQSGTTDAYLNNATSPEYTEITADQGAPVTLPAEKKEDGSGYDHTEVEAVFSIEYLASDNMGDINQDAIPDIFVDKYGFGVVDPETSQITAGADLESKRGFNEDEDYLPGSGTAYFASLIPGLDKEAWKKQAQPFTAEKEIRGYGEALNDAPQQLGIKNVKPDLIYTDPRTDGKSTLTLAEYLAWCEFAAVNYPTEEGAYTNRAHFADWSPERPSDPTKEDTDEDGFPDGYEYHYWYMAHVGWIDAAGNHRRLTGRAYDERNPGEGRIISSETIEALMDPLVASGDSSSAQTRDSDNDGLPDLLEFDLGTDPFDFDTDGDGLPDGWEIMIAGTDPLVAYTLAGTADSLRNFDGDAMAFTTTVKESDVKPKPNFISKLWTFAVRDERLGESFGDSNGLQWFVVRPEDMTGETPAVTFKVVGAAAEEEKPYQPLGTKITVGGVGYVCTGAYSNDVPVVVETDKAGNKTYRLAVAMPKTSTFKLGSKVKVADAEYDDVALTPTYIPAGTRLDEDQTNGFKYAWITLAKVTKGKCNAGWVYGQKATSNIGVEFGMLTIGRYLDPEVNDAVIVCEEPRNDREVAYVHSLVYQEFGFDPRTAWNPNTPLAKRWGTADYEDQTSGGKGGYTGKATRTRPYTAYDEFLLHSFFVNAGVDMSGFVKIAKDAPDWAVIWGAFTTNPQGPNEEIDEIDGHYYGRNSANGADTDGDGVPDGWELYIMAGPKETLKDGTKKYVFAPPYTEFYPACRNPDIGEEGKAKESYWSPFVGFAKDAATDNTNYVGKDRNDNLTEWEEFAGTDTCAYYADYSETITRPAGQEKWINKFLPTDPWNPDTDGDGIKDGNEGGFFVYDGNEDDGTKKFVAGGGLNPCTLDTDQDGLPDPWEADYAGKTVDADPANGYIDGMDGTVADAVTLPGGVNRDYDHDGLENFQEYLTGTMRCWRYDDPYSTWTYFPSSLYFDGDDFNAAKAVKSLAAAGKLETALEDPDDEESDSFKTALAEFWVKTLFDKTSPLYNPYLVTETSPGGMYWTHVANGWDINYVDIDLDKKRPGGNFYFLRDRVNGVEFKELWQEAFSGIKDHPAIRYGTCSPINYDSDGDGMDDYYELFHGLNPLLYTPGLGHPDGAEDGAVDLVANAYNDGVGYVMAWGMMANYWMTVQPRAGEIEPRGNGYDFRVYPWMNGQPDADPDGDDIRNQVEAIMPRQATATWRHTDPTPLWMTDSSYTNSLTRMFYRLPRRSAGIAADALGMGTIADENGEQVPGVEFGGKKYFLRDTESFDVAKGTFQSFIPDVFKLSGSEKVYYNWMFSFEENEGYDSDHDAISDYEEVEGKFRAATDPQDADSPHRRQAMYFPGENAVLQTMPRRVEAYPARGSYPPDPSFLQFTVECWANPEETDRAQVIVERAIYSGQSNPGDEEYVRKNFQLAVRDGKWYAKFDSNGTRIAPVEVFSSDPATVGWHHLAATFDGSQLLLYVDGNPQVPTRTELQPEYGYASTSVTGVGDNGSAPGDFHGGFSYLFHAIVVGGALRQEAQGGDGQATDVTMGIGWSAYHEFFRGYVDEIRIWDGARSQDEIRAAMRTRYTRELALENRTDFYAQWSKGQVRYSNDTASEGYRVIPELRYHFHFDSVPGAADAADVAKAPHGFDYSSTDINGKETGKASLSRPEDYEISWWKGVLEAYTGTVYGNPAWVQWIPNTVTHLPRFDGSTLDSQFWSENYAGWTNGVFKFARTAEPVSLWTQYIRNEADPSDYYTTGMQHYRAKGLADDTNNVSTALLQFNFTGRHLNQSGDDLLPLGGAFVKYCTDLWDGQGASTTWEIAATDSDNDGLPDWWDAYARQNYMPEDADPSTPLTWDTIIVYDGIEMRAGEAYRRDLAKGTSPVDGKVVERAFPQVADEDGSRIPDWWEELYQISGEGGTTDTDNDGLNNRAEYLVSEVYTNFNMRLNPRMTKSDLKTNDYFRTVGKLYLGEMFTDHDLMEDHWEREIGDPDFVDANVWDALKDADEDGWTNFDENRYNGYSLSTLPKLIAHAVGDSEVLDAPTPTIKLKVRYNEPRELIAGTGGDEKKPSGEGEGQDAGVALVVQTFTDADMMESDATFRMTPGKSVSRELYFGSWENRVVRGNLAPGHIDLSSVDVKHAQIPRSDKYSWTDENGIHISGTYAEFKEALAKNSAIIQNIENFEWRIFEPPANQYTSADRAVTVDENGNLNFYGERVGHIDLLTGDFEFDFTSFNKLSFSYLYDGSKGPNAGIGMKEFIYKITYTSKIPDFQRKSCDVSLAKADKGFVKGGKNAIMAYYDLANDGYTPGVDPMGVIRGVDVGWNGADVELELKTMSAVTPRVDLWSAVSDRAVRTEATAAEKQSGGYGDEEEAEPEGNVSFAPAAEKETRVRVLRYRVDDAEPFKVGVREARVIFDRVFQGDVRNFIHEGDILRDGEYDLDWTNLANDLSGAGIAAAGIVVTNVDYLIVFGDGKVDYDTVTDTNKIITAHPVLVSRRFERNRTAPTAIQENMTCTEARPTFRWSIDNEDIWASRYGTTYTAFQVKVWNAAGALVYESGYQGMPVPDSDGVYSWTAPLYVGAPSPSGTHLVFANLSNYTWQVFTYNSKFRSDDAGSAKLVFRMNVTTDDDSTFALPVKVAYAGPAKTLTGRVHVQAFTTPDFVGAPASETVLDKANGDVSIRGLRAGTYFVRAYIDTDRDFRHSDWESWGYLNGRDNACVGGNANIFTPVAVTVGSGIEIKDPRTLYIEDCDTNGNRFPDVWEAEDNRGRFDPNRIPPVSGDAELIRINPNLTNDLEKVSQFEPIDDMLRTLSTLRGVSLWTGINTEDVAPTANGFEIKSEVDPETLTIVGFAVDAAQNRVLLKVGAETTANVDAVVANFLNITVRKGAEVTVKVERADSPNGPWSVVPGVGGTVTVDRAGADIEVKLDGELPAQGYFRAKIEE